MTDPCTDLEIFVGNSSSVKYSPQLAIGKWPNLAPTLLNGIQWTNYGLYEQNFTISAWDPNFDGGYVCGPNKNEICTYVIGVTAWCDNTTITKNVDQSIPYTLIVNAKPAHAIFNVPQVKKQVGEGQTDKYKFCVREKTLTTAELMTWESSVQCPNSYANLQMVISNTNPNANINDIVWRIDNSSLENTIYLFANESGARVGSCKLF